MARQQTGQNLPQNHIKLCFVVFQLKMNVTDYRYDCWSGRKEKRGVWMKTRDIVFLLLQTKVNRQLRRDNLVT